MEKTRCLLLCHLIESECFSEIQSKTASCIAKDVSISGSNDRKILRELVAKGYVKIGLRSRNADTFYITQSGVNEYNKWRTIKILDSNHNIVSVEN